MADHETNSALQGVATGLENLKATLSGISQGLQNLGAGVQSGGSAAMAGLGRMMPSTAIPTMGPMGLPRHGMYAQEMTFSKSAGMLSGLGTKPQTCPLMKCKDLPHVTWEIALQALVPWQRYMEQGR